MKIGIDMDGVLCDFVKGYNKLAKAELGIDLPYPATTWNWHLDNGMTQAQADKLWEIIKATTFHGTLHPLEGAMESIERLNKLSVQGHEVYFITNRSGAMAKFYAEMWLRFHGMDTPTVLIAKHKGPIADGLQLDVFVDDLPDNNGDVSRWCPTTRVYLVSQPYNEWATDRSYGTRIASLNLVLDREFPREEQKAA